MLFMAGTNIPNAAASWGGRRRALELRLGCVCRRAALVSHSIKVEDFYLL